MDTESGVSKKLLDGRPSNTSAYILGGWLNGNEGDKVPLRDLTGMENIDEWLSWEILLIWRPVTTWRPETGLIGRLFGQVSPVKVGIECGSAFDSWLAGLLSGLLDDSSDLDGDSDARGRLLDLEPPVNFGIGRSENWPEEFISLEARLDDDGGIHGGLTDRELCESGSDGPDLDWGLVGRESLEEGGSDDPDLGWGLVDSESFDDKGSEALSVNPELFRMALAELSSAMFSTD